MDIKKEFILTLMKFSRKDIIKESQIGLTKSEVSILFYLYFAYDKVCAKNMVEDLVFSKSMVTMLLNDLEDKEYVEKYNDIDDKRKTIIKLTKKGNNFVKSTMENVSEKIDMFIEKLGEEDFKTFLNLTNKILEVENE